MLAKAIEWGDVPTESPVVHGVRADSHSVAEAFAAE
jgi:hypothetical protein